MRKYFRRDQSIPCFAQRSSKQRSACFCCVFERVDVIFTACNDRWIPRKHAGKQAQDDFAVHKAKWHERGPKENGKEDGWNERKSQYAGVPSAGEIAKLN